MQPYLPISFLPELDYVFLGLVTTFFHRQNIYVTALCISLPLQENQQVNNTRNNIENNAQ